MKDPRKVWVIEESYKGGEWRAVYASYWWNVARAELKPMRARWPASTFRMISYHPRLDREIGSRVKA